MYLNSKCSNVSRSSIIGVFGSQVIRFFRICNSFNGFKKRLEIIVIAFITLGFERKLLLNRYKYIDNKHAKFIFLAEISKTKSWRGQKWPNHWF